MIAKSLQQTTALPGKNPSFPVWKAMLQLLLPMIFISSLMAQQAKPIAPKAPVINKEVEAPKKPSGITYKSGNHRDPFLNLLLVKPKGDEEMSRGVPPAGIAGTYIAQAVLQGTSVRDKGRIAVVRGADSRAYFLREGDKLFDGYVRTIDYDSITLVRVTKMKSGKVLTQDVTKRLRTP